MKIFNTADPQYETGVGHSFITRAIYEIDVI
jgi:hypothetical protein